MPFAVERIGAIAAVEEVVAVAAVQGIVARAADERVGSVAAIERDPPVNPVASSMLLPVPPVNLASVMPLKLNDPPAERLRKLSVNRKLPPPDASTVSAPPPPVSVADPVQEPTVKCSPPLRRSTRPTRFD